MPVHKLILASNSEYFKNILSTENFQETGVKEIILNDIEPNALELLIDYIYTLKLNITKDNVQVKLKKNFI